MVRVGASSINGSDLNLRLGGVMGLITTRVSPGFDLAGTVIACGPEVTAFEVGDRVMALLPHGGGGQAELVVLEQRRAALVPDSMTDAAAAALPLAGLTALQALRGRARLQQHTSPTSHAGRRVLVNGAAGGIGSFAVQLAAMLGAHVTAITSGDRAEFVTGLGAHDVLDRRDNSAMTRAERWDVVLDIPGSLRFRDIRPSLTPTGVLVSTRPVGRDSLYAVAGRAQSAGPRYTFVTTSPSSQDLTHLARLVDRGRLTVPIDSVYPADRVAEAYRRAAGGAVRGKVVIEF